MLTVQAEAGLPAEQLSTSDAGPVEPFIDMVGCCPCEACASCAVMQLDGFHSPRICGAACSTPLLINAEHAHMQSSAMLSGLA